MGQAGAEGCQNFKDCCWIAAVPQVGCRSLTAACSSRARQTLAKERISVSYHSCSVISTPTDRHDAPPEPMFVHPSGLSLTAARAACARPLGKITTVPTSSAQQQIGSVVTNSHHCGMARCLLFSSRHKFVLTGLIRRQRTSKRGARRPVVAAPARPTERTPLRCAPTPARPIRRGHCGPPPLPQVVAGRRACRMQ